ncbi:MAG TPA: phytanoyl-CoA dioxygenase family protein [Tepidisphaeraceae bacterium]|jgi:ectoine hydroxylase-related dioxygenase (phytanoyl-CoA dioxygenase family)
MTQLTPDQRGQFDRDGYLILPGVFSADEIRRMRTEADYILELILNSSLANKRRSGRLDWQRLPDGRQIVRKIQPINDLSLYLSRISADPRLLDPMRDIMADEPVLMEEKLNYKQPLPQPLEGIAVRDTDDRFPIHHDWAYYSAQNYPQNILSSAVSMDDSTETSGPIRVWPGTHKTFLEHEPCDIGLQVKPGLLDPNAHTSILAPAGSVMIFHSLLVHDSRPNTSGKPRRLMIYSHYPAKANMGFDVRNGPGRLTEAPWERQYLRMKEAGVYKDQFHAPKVPGYENAGNFWTPAEGKTG